MNRERAFFRLTAALVLAGAAVFEAGAGSFLFLAAALAVCVFFERNERSEQPWRLSHRLANMLSLVGFLGTIYLVYLSPYGAARGTFDFRVPVVGRYLLFVQAVLLFKEHTNRDFAWIYFISLVHVAGSSLLMPELAFAPLYLGYVALAVATLTVYQQKVERDRAGKSRLARRERMRWSLLPKSALAATALMVPAGFVFALLPRGEAGAFGRMAQRSVQPITGFSESVRLGDLGRILQNPERVMQVRVLDDEDKPVRVEGLLMRGLALDHYDGRRWQATGEREQQISSDGEMIEFQYRSRERMAFMRQAPLVRAEVTLEPLATSTLFAPFSVVGIRLPDRRALAVEGMNEVLRAGWRRRETLEYEVQSRVVQEIMHRAAALEEPSQPQWAEPDGRYLALPDGMPDRVRELAAQVVRWDEDPTPYQRAERISAYLSDPANFRYTLDTPVMRSEHPVDEFLFRHEEGHCEYFATAMAVMLRAVNVEARVVNGFSGGEWNGFAQALVFRQRDAHAWVEAHIPGAGWLPFDPSPPAEAAHGRDGALRAGARNFMEFLDQMWVVYVVAFDQEKQSAFYAVLRKPRDLLHHLMTFTIWRALGTEALLRDDLVAAVGEQVAKYRWVAGVPAALLGALAAWAGWRKVRRWRRRPKGAGRAAARFYQDLLRLLRRRGFAKPPELTPAEFADRVREAVGPPADPVQEITWRYYGTRYGGQAVSSDEESALRATLRQIDSDLAQWRREERQRAKAASQTMAKEG